jgi:nitrite reductase/ring-hydroxylating ferredoxin subunit
MVQGHGPSSTSTITGRVPDPYPDHCLPARLGVTIRGMRSLPQLDRVRRAGRAATALDSHRPAGEEGVDTACPTHRRDALHGVWLGHPLHPALILVPLGSWMSATALDLLPGRRRDAAGRWSVSGWPARCRPRRRLGRLVRPAPPAAAHRSSCTPPRTGSIASSSPPGGPGGRAGRPRRRLSLTALSVGGAAAYLGGHLGLPAGRHGQPRRGGPAHPARPVDAGGPAGRAARRRADPAHASTACRVFVLRRGRQVDVLYDLCSHLSGPLSEGELSGAGDADVHHCPWHGSTFRLRDGQVQRGPTTYPQPVLQVRVDPDGSVQARLGKTTDHGTRQATSTRPASTTRWSTRSTG